MSRALVLGLVAGAVLRALVIVSPGMSDVGTWKAWSAVAATEPLGLYGVGGSPPERRVLAWNGVRGTTEYPPLGLYELAVVGRVYRALEPDFRDSPRLTALIKTPGLLAECFLVAMLLTLGQRVLGSRAAQWMALAIWLNPAVMIDGAALGYLDAQMAVPAVLAFVAVIAGRPALAGALMAAAVFTKPQALFVGPALLLALRRQTRVSVTRAFVRFGVAGVVTSAVIVLPIVWNGAWANMAQAVGRTGSHDMLSGFALNVWWILTWIVRASHGAPVVGWVEAFTAPVGILSITRFMEVGYPNPKPMAALVVIGLIAFGSWRHRRATNPAAWAYLGGWTVLTYFLWNVQVHENHLYLAVPMFALAAALDSRYRVAFWIVSAITAFNMYLFYGLGAGWAPVIGRYWSFIDLSVIASFVVCAVWLWLTFSVRPDTRFPRQRRS